MPVGDMTQIDTEEGPLYLAMVEDMFARWLRGVLPLVAWRPGPERWVRR